MAEQEFCLRRNGKVTVAYSDRESSAVQIAVSNLISDLEKVFDSFVSVKKLEDGAVCPTAEIVVFSLDAEERIAAEIASQHRLSVDLLMDEGGKRRWEGYLQQVSGKTLYIVGTDRRGTIYGIYDLCERLGVSPWHYWADVPVKRKEYFGFPGHYRKADWPAVPFRGIFLNDEEELDVWARSHTKDDTIGPEAYERIFELLLRLKGNYIWPAMHVNYFNENPENGRLAERMGIVVGTSHCDMLLRSNQNEWDPWLKQKGYQNIEYDYSIPGENREVIREYWRESVEINRDNEVCYTVGMRGIHDTGFITREIESDGSLDPDEKRKKKIQLLEQVISDQRQILKDVLGEKRADNAVETFIPYKEVLELYDQGLKVPDDVTLIWVDDNFGYMRRYPTEEERNRSGGNGLYYHASYWAAPGMSYLFFNSIPLAHTGNELKKCWESGIRKMWVLNVGALKPLELDMEFFLWYGWNAGKAEEELDILSFTQNWADRNFSGNFGSRIAGLYHDCMQLTNVCKLEHMQAGKFSQDTNGNEGEKRLKRLGEIYVRGTEICLKLPEEEQAAFFEMILMKLHASYYINASFYYADRSRLSYDRGAMQAADFYLEKSREMDDKKRRLLYYYNKELENGKWDKILTPESFSPPPTVLYPAGKPALVIGPAQLGMVETGRIEFWSYGASKKSLIVFNKGKGQTFYRVNGPDWLEIEHRNGAVAAEQEIGLWVKRDQREKCFETGCKGWMLISGEHGELFSVEVCCVRNEISIHDLPESCYVEADGSVSIPADGGCLVGSAEDVGWRIVRGIGRGCGNAVEAYCQREFVSESGFEKAPYLEYSFYVQSQGSFCLEIFRFLTLNSTGRIRFAVKVDEEDPVVLESGINDEWTKGWKQAVMNDGEKMYMELPYLIPGIHRLKVYMIDPYVTFTKFVIYTGQKVDSNMGPAFGVNAGRLRCRTDEEGNFCEGSLGELEKKIYGKPGYVLPLLPMLYADKEFWTVNRLYLLSDEREQKVMGEPRYLPDADGAKNVFAEFGKGAFREEDGRIAIEAEYALENSENAYLTPDRESGKIFWSHTQAETDGRSGLAMMIETEGLYWKDSSLAPGMHYRIEIAEAGNYDVWLLIKFEDWESDACRLALDGILQHGKQQYSGGNLFTYSMKQRWNWQAITSMNITAGAHTLSVYGKKSGLRIDRIYLTRKGEWPPLDHEWRVSRI